MKVFIAGATGATGRLVAMQLLEQGHSVVTLARQRGSLPNAIEQHPAMSCIIGDISMYSPTDLAPLMHGCDAVVSCLGHNLTVKGIWGKPRRLVAEVLEKLYNSALSLQDSSKPIRFILMNSNGVLHPGGKDQIHGLDKVLIAIVRALVPPQKDNEMAAQFLYSQPSQSIEWTIVRPDSLIDEPSIGEYEVFDYAQTGPIIKSGHVSRINVAAFMVELMTNDGCWRRWSGGMPVVYNQGSFR